jgi:hypothetical protein
LKLQPTIIILISKLLHAGSCSTQVAKLHTGRGSSYPSCSISQLEYFCAAASRNSASSDFFFAVLLNPRFFAFVHDGLVH